MRSLPHSRVALATFLMILVGAVSAFADEPEPIKQPEIGERAVDFELPVVGEKSFLRLSDEYREGPVVVIVLRGYPGYQCPLCNRQVSSLANRVRALSNEAHRVILVYPGEPTLLERHAEQFMGSRRVPDPLILVRDDGMNMVQDWGLRWDAINETAYPATFVVDQNGRIAWKKVSDSHAGRSSTEEILKELRKL
ncbi:MAG: redoxin family protein [Rubripirellula sp.]